MAIVVPKEKESDMLTKETEVKPFSIDEQLKFIEPVQGDEDEMLYIAALDSGLRQGELFTLTWKDIDFDNRIIKVDKAFKVVKNIETGINKSIRNTYLKTCLFLNFSFFLNSSLNS